VSFLFRPRGVTAPWSVFESTTQVFHSKESTLITGASISCKELKYNKNISLIATY
jgi:hypothetical protein